VRRALFAIALLTAACRGDAATVKAPAGQPSRADGPIHPSGVSDEELAAFTRWRRDYVELFQRHRAELDAVGAEDPAAALRDRKAFEARVAEVVAGQAPAMKAMLARQPVMDQKLELLTEAVGGIFHYDYTPSGPYTLVVARDEVRIEAARRRFGKDVVDDIVAREELILAALRGE
jgi:hypothetical protein